MGRRASTLRVHVRTGEKMRLFCASCLDKSWFGSVADVMDYIAGRLEEPCGKSIPVSIMGALKFLESAAEVPQETRLSEHPVLLNFMAEISMVDRTREGECKSTGGRGRSLLGVCSHGGYREELCPGLRVVQVDQALGHAALE